MVENYVKVVRVSVDLSDIRDEVWICDTNIDRDKYDYQDYIVHNSLVILKRLYFKSSSCSTTTLAQELVGLQNELVNELEKKKKDPLIYEIWNGHRLLVEVEKLKNSTQNELPKTKKVLARSLDHLLDANPELNGAAQSGWSVIYSTNVCTEQQGHIDLDRDMTQALVVLDNHKLSTEISLNLTDMEPHICDDLKEVFNNFTKKNYESMKEVLLSPVLIEANYIKGIPHARIGDILLVRGGVVHRSPNIADEVFRINYFAAFTPTAVEEYHSQTQFSSIVLLYSLLTKINTISVKNFTDEKKNQIISLIFDEIYSRLAVEHKYESSYFIISYASKS